MDGRRKDLFDKIKDRTVEEPDRSALVDTPCWIWQGPFASADPKRQYPRMNVDNATMAPHRVMWAIFNGPIPPKKQIDHVCNVPCCVNPAHLEMVTNLENQRRKKRRKKNDALI